MGFEFVQATKQGSKARIALTGVAGAGKTWTALQIAEGLTFDGNIGLIDTERQSARKYADRFAFRWCGMSSYDPDDLTRAVLDAGRQGVGVLIVDTWSPFWSGADGLLDRVGQASNNFEGWRQMRPVERRMFDALLGYRGHVIVTMRVKTEYVVDRGENGRMEPRRVGLKPDQRDGTEHEFDVVIDLQAAGTVARVTKTRCPELAEQAFTRPGREVGETIQAWLDRDAVGEPLNPYEIRDWALAEPRSRDEVRERYAALEVAGQLDAVVYDRAEALVTIGELLLVCGRAAKEREERARKAEAGAMANGAGQ